MICGEKIRKNEKRLKKKKQAVVPDVTDLAAGVPVFILVALEDCS